MKAIAATRIFFTATVSMQTRCGNYNDAGDNRMVKQRIPVKFTRSGNWNGKGPVVSGINIQ